MQTRDFRRIAGKQVNTGKQEQKQILDISDD